MNATLLRAALAAHAAWLMDTSKGTRADLSGANLSGANLSGADLSGANLSGANLSGANLYRASLSGANLSWANLSWANLSWANLCRANLCRADISWANLYRANLSEASLSGANLSGANLSGANLSGAKDLSASVAAILQTLPDEGDVVGWKKLGDGTVCKLRIPAEARRSNATGRKCRAEYADVIEGSGVSAYDGKTEYRPGVRVTCDKWCEDRWAECAGGIHFFITRKEAEDYEQ